MPSIVFFSIIDNVIQRFNKKEPDLAIKQSRAVDYNLVLSVYEKIKFIYKEKYFISVILSFRMPLRSMTKAFLLESLFKSVSSSVKYSL